MAAPTSYFVDPSIAANSGTGTIGDPYGDIQYALNTVTRNATDGDKFNIKAGTAEVLTSALSYATYGTPARDQPVIYRGYTSAEDDGGIGSISGAATYSVMATNYVRCYDMELYNSGSAAVISARVSLYHCHIHTTTGDGFNAGAYWGTVENCWFENISGLAISWNAANGYIRNCFIDGTQTNKFAGYAVNLNANASLVMEDCIIKIASGSAAHGAGLSPNYFTQVRNNTVYCQGSGTGLGFRVVGSSRAYSSALVNNVVEGFSGTGGGGISFLSGGQFDTYGHNKVYNCATAFSLGTTGILNNLGNNDTLGASPFTDPGTNDFSVDTTLKALSIPSSFYGANTNQFRDVGAAQREEPAGGAGGLLTHPGMTGGTRG